MTNGKSGKQSIKKSVSHIVCWITVGLVRQQTIAYSTGDQRPQERNREDLLPGKPADLDDRIERVKISRLGMQRYDWEQGAVEQTFLEMGEDDLAISFAREAILKPISLQ